MEMETRISGIPCVIRVDSYFRQRPNPRAENSDDYLGYVEIYWTVCDRNGRPAPWLERKATDEDSQRIEAELIEQLQGEIA